MQRLLRIILAVLVPLALVAFTVTFTVRFTESAVVTTFGKAAEGDVKRAPGLYFKWPYPIQKYVKYDTRQRLLSLKVETQQTFDNRQIAVETFCTWRVADPLRFNQTFGTAGERAEEHYRRAEETLKANLRAATSVVSNYRIEDLFTDVSGNSKLPELEQRMLNAFRQAPDQQGSKLADYGVEAVDVGLTRVLLPEEVTKAVFERMKAGRERLAQEIETRGQSEAQSIRDKASNDARNITTFAEGLAAEIRRRGDFEAVPFLTQMNKKPELAVFLKNIEFIKNMEPRTATYVVTGSIPGIGLMMPDALVGLRPGELPESARPANWLQQSMTRPVVGGTGAVERKQEGDK